MTTRKQRQIHDIILQWMGWKHHFNKLEFYLRQSLLPSRQSQRSAVLKSRRNSVRALSKSMHWIMEGFRKASLKTLALIALAFLRIFRCPLKFAGVVCRIAAVVLPLLGLYLYFNPYAKMTPLLWQRGAIWEVYAFAGAALWVWLETVCFQPNQG